MRKFLRSRVVKYAFRQGDVKCLFVASDFPSTAARCRPAPSIAFEFIKFIMRTLPVRILGLCHSGNRTSEEHKTARADLQVDIGIHQHLDSI
ncbi:hypothetical protein DICSQDRAFT_140290 [Dichomitus squalens LYAD-421 SS1]|uniref:Uncharacterized protein n=1 Tax=Dichomitus squalens (strain LYAD-421) TaxID=732165 RepID=R7SN28_DICSQ|nr:uncharacterized protein DICSQDRAFT_140290 [Dichomitus squalens LYAD-421 SS1]EJF57531.1 hypothetical protein DICSQDRAFT_140290 [Dichomitus squalens LYAD-421 SS1]